MDSRKYLIFYVRNLEFEFQFIKKYFKWDNVFATEPHKVLYARTVDGFEFKCSYFLAGCSLETTTGQSEDFGRQYPTDGAQRYAFSDGRFPNNNPDPNNDKNLILEFQLAAQKDGFEFPKYGADGYYGKETEDVMKICIVKRRETFKNKNVTKLVQQLLGINDDGLCGKNTENAIKTFQSKHGLISDGCVGLKTWKVLLNIK